MRSIPSRSQIFKCSRLAFPLLVICLFIFTDMVFGQEDERRDRPVRVGNGCLGNACRSVHFSVDNRGCIQVTNKSERKIRVELRSGHGSLSQPLSSGTTKTFTLGGACVTPSSSTGTSTANYDN